MVKAQRLISLCEDDVSGVRLYLRPGQSGSVRDQTVRVCGWEGEGVNCSPYRSVQTQP